MRLIILCAFLISCTTTSTVNHDKRVAGIRVRKDRTIVKKTRVMGVTVHKKTYKTD